MILSLGILLLLLATCGAAPSVDHSVFEKGVLVSDSEVTGYLTDHRWERSLASLGLATLKLLLKGAEHVYSTTRERVFFKSGGYAKASDDFNRLSATNVKVMRIKGEVIKQGNIGDRKVFLAKGDRSNSPALVISQSSAPPRRGVYIIYKN